MLLQEVIERVRKGEIDGRAELRALLAENPRDRDALGDLAFIEATHGDHRAALRLYLRYVHAGLPTHAEPHWRIGDRLVSLSRLDRAERVYRGVLKRWPDCLDSRIGLRYVAYLRSDRAHTPRAEPVAPSPATPDRREANRELNARELKGKALSLKSRPPGVHIESTTKCNFYCQTCTKGHAPYFAEDLDPTVFEKFSEQVLPYVDHLVVTGFGEPTYSAMFDRLVQAADERSVPVHFTTNGSLLDFGRIERLLRSRTELAISIDGATSVTFEAIRRGSSFDRIIEKLAMIKKVHDVLLSESKTILLFNFVALRSNIHELPDVVRLAHRFGVCHVCAVDYGLQKTEFDSESLRYGPAMANRFLDEAEAVARELGVRLQAMPHYSEETPPPPPPRAGLLRKLFRVRRVFPVPNRFPRMCHSPWSEPYIKVDGRVFPCCTNDVSMGNINEQSFEEIWNGPAYRRLRKRIVGALPPFLCRSCVMGWGINAGNVGNVMAQEGLILKLWYYLEHRLYRWRKSREAKRLGQPPPNFEAGRPVS